ncbi:MAG: hypothetical protein RQ982_06870 [Gammaproteobacteria bacterium]|nr:hypothetical protein [Gammaproteobacteria bacterium]
MADGDVTLPVRTIFFTVDDYATFEQRLLNDGRARYLYIQGRKVVDVDSRSADSRDKTLCVGKFTIKNLPHYEGLISVIHKVAIEYEKIISQI